jgi:hypothetical protein
MKAFLANLSLCSQAILRKHCVLEDFHPSLGNYPLKNFAAVDETIIFPLL